MATALREADEEVGLDPSCVEILGALPPRLTHRSDLWLTPIAGLQRRPFTVRGDGHEVAEWFWVPLGALLTAPHRTEERTSEGGQHHLVHHYEAEGRTIWGVTGGIVHDLLERPDAWLPRIKLDPQQQPRTGVPGRGVRSVERAGAKAAVARTHRSAVS